MPRNKNFDRNGEDAAVIVREFKAGRCHKSRFEQFLQGRLEWLNRYKRDTLKRNYKRVIERYESWLRGGKEITIATLPH